MTSMQFLKSLFNSYDKRCVVREDFNGIAFILRNHGETVLTNFKGEERLSPFPFDYVGKCNSFKLYDKVYVWAEERDFFCFFCLKRNYWCAIGMEEYGEAKEARDNLARARESFR